MGRHMIAVPFGPHGQTVSRLAPLGDPRAYKTYGASMPLRTHWRAGTCEEAACEALCLGARLYGDKPGRFADRIAGWWTLWRDEPPCKDDPVEQDGEGAQHE